MTRFGGLWLLSSPAAEIEVRDALDVLREKVPMNERDESWLATSLDHVQGQLQPFLVYLAADSIGQGTHEEWHEWLAGCQCRWQPADEQPAIQYFPTARYHPGIEPDCLVHGAIEGCNRFCTLIEDEWIKVADWYQNSTDLAKDQMAPL